ncbi:hypothetical protein K1T71_011921 [Dendrolimus kikuchii]|uniref:Uncharacterized protein n=1 Tax=Dendrolimus kikuchii TaxID=765133 RepID=A0ACC1CMT4_9NEOP|nr:hypothetical protein K1T71_011921 [Dendrolimus kikuchii]
MRTLITLSGKKYYNYFLVLQYNEKKTARELRAAANWGIDKKHNENRGPDQGAHSMFSVNDI